MHLMHGKTTLGSLPSKFLLYGSYLSLNLHVGSHKSYTSSRLQTIDASINTLRKSGGYGKVYMHCLQFHGLLVSEIFGI